MGRRPGADRRRDGGWGNGGRACGGRRRTRPPAQTYDSSPIHAAGGRALTISVQDGSIPNLHWPTDVIENIDPDGVARTLEAGAELVAAIDRGYGGLKTGGRQARERPKPDWGRDAAAIATHNRAGAMYEGPPKRCGTP